MEIKASHRFKENISWSFVLVHWCARITFTHVSELCGPWPFCISCVPRPLTVCSVSAVSCGPWLSVLYQLCSAAPDCLFSIRYRDPWLSVLYQVPRPLTVCSVSAVYRGPWLSVLYQVPRPLTVCSVSAVYRGPWLWLCSVSGTAPPDCPLCIRWRNGSHSAFRQARLHLRTHQAFAVGGDDVVGWQLGHPARLQPDGGARAWAVLHGPRLSGR